MKTLESDEFVSIHTIANQFEGDILKSALEEEGIPVIVRTFHDTAYDGIYIPQKGWGQLMVPSGFEQRSRSVVGDILKDIEKGGSRYENPQNIDPEFWERLLSVSPEDVVARAKVHYDENKNVYRIPFLNETVICRPEDRLIYPENPKSKITSNFQFYLIILTYLLEASDMELSGVFVNEKGIRGGEFFFKGPHMLLTKNLETKFARDRDGFLLAGRSLGGEELNIGDAAFKLWPLPRIPLVYILWLEDEEFPAKVAVNFDSTIDQHLPLDVIWALVNVVSELLVK